MVASSSLGSTTTFADLMEYESSRRRAADPEDATAVAACAAAFEAEAPGVGDPIDMSLAIPHGQPWPTRPFLSARGWMCSNIQCDSTWRTISGVCGSAFEREIPPFGKRLRH